MEHQTFPAGTVVSIDIRLLKNDEKNGIVIMSEANQVNVITDKGRLMSTFNDEEAEIYLSPLKLVKFSRRYDSFERFSDIFKDEFEAFFE